MKPETHKKSEIKTNRVCKKKGPADILCNILLVLCAGVFLFSCGKLVSYFVEYRQGEQAYESVLEEAVVIPETQEGEISDEESGETVLPVLDWNTLIDMNEDLIGWLYIPDTVINYPIVFSGENSHYLTHTFDGQYNPCGCIFMDMSNQSDFTSDNTVLHGHNMKTGKMFGSLRKFDDYDYWKEHQYIWIITEDHVMKYHIFSASITEAASDVYTLEFSSEDSFQTYIQRQSKTNCHYETGVEVTTEDRLLTLSTCTSDTETGRRVVQAKLVEIKEIENEQ